MVHSDLFFYCRNPLIQIPHPEGGAVLSRAVPRGAVLYVPSSIPIAPIANYLEGKNDTINGMESGILQRLKPLSLNMNGLQYSDNVASEAPFTMRIRLRSWHIDNGKLQQSLKEYAHAVSKITIDLIEDSNNCWDFALSIIRYVSILRRGDNSFRKIEFVIESPFNVLYPKTLKFIDEFNCTFIADEERFTDKSRSLNNIRQFANSGAKIPIRMWAASGYDYNLYERGCDYLEANRDSGLALSVVYPVIYRQSVYNSERLPNPEFLVENIRKIRYKLISSDDALDYLANIKDRIVSRIPMPPTCNVCSGCSVFLSASGEVSFCRYSGSVHVKPIQRQNESCSTAELLQLNCEEHRTQVNWYLARLCGDCPWLHLCGGICVKTLGSCTRLSEAISDILKRHWCYVRTEIIKDMLIDIASASSAYMAKEEVS